MKRMADPAALISTAPQHVREEVMHYSFSVRPKVARLLATDKRLADIEIACKCSIRINSVPHRQYRDQKPRTRGSWTGDVTLEVAMDEAGGDYPRSVGRLAKLVSSCGGQWRMQGVIKRRSPAHGAVQFQQPQQQELPQVLAVLAEDLRTPAARLLANCTRALLAEAAAAEVTSAYASTKPASNSMSHGLTNAAGMTVHHLPPPELMEEAQDCASVISLLPLELQVLSTMHLEPGLTAPLLTAHRYSLELQESQETITAAGPVDGSVRLLGSVGRAVTDCQMLSAATCSCLPHVVALETGCLGRWLSCPDQTQLNEHCRLPRPEFHSLENLALSTAALKTHASDSAAPAAAPKADQWLLRLFTAQTTLSCGDGTEVAAAVLCTSHRLVSGARVANAPATWRKLPAATPGTRGGCSSCLAASLASLPPNLCPVQLLKVASACTRHRRSAEAPAWTVASSLAANAPASQLMRPGSLRVTEGAPPPSAHRRVLAGRLLGNATAGIGLQQPGPLLSMATDGVTRRDCHQAAAALTPTMSAPVPAADHLTSASAPADIPGADGDHRLALAPGEIVECPDFLPKASASSAVVGRGLGCVCQRAALQDGLGSAARLVVYPPAAHGFGRAFALAYFTSKL